MNVSEAYQAENSYVKTEDNCYLENNTTNTSLYNGGGLIGDRPNNRITGIRDFNKTKENWKD